MGKRKKREKDKKRSEIMKEKVYKLKWTRVI